MRHAARPTLLALSAAALSLLAGPAALAQDDTTRAIARLATPGGEPAGSVEFTATPNGVIVIATLSGLEPGEHGFHLHETGVCDGDFTSAGGHFAPHGNKHGFRSEDGPHAGDLPNVFVGVDGTSTSHHITDRVTLDQGETGLFDEDGTAVIVHESADSYGDEAGAGGRVACGIVEPYI